MTKTPKNPIKVPSKILFLSFSRRIIRQPASRKIGPEVAMIGALIEGASLSPKKKKEIFIVIPKRERIINFGQSSFFILREWTARGRRRQEAREKRRKARVNGWILVNDHLKIGEAAPQIILAKINARIACFLLVSAMKFGLSRAPFLGELLFARPSPCF